MSSDSTTSSGEPADSGSGLKEPIIINHAPRTGNPKKGGTGMLIQRGASGAIDSTPHFVASAPATSTGQPRKSTTATSGRTTPQLTLESSTLDPYQTLTSWSRAFLASPSAWRGSGSGFRTRVAPSSLRLLGLLRSNDLGYCSLRTSKASSPTTKDALSLQSSPRWMNWGMTLNGRCLTASISASRRTEKGSSLSDILEENPSEKYFLSNKALKSLLGKAQLLELSKGEHIQEVIIPE